MKKLLLIIIIALTVLFFTARPEQPFGGTIDKQINKEGIPLNLQLKVDSSNKILDSKEVDTFVENADGFFTKGNKIVSYDYISDVVVSTTTYTAKVDGKNKVMTEIMEKRTANSHTYETGRLINGQPEHITKFYGGSPFWKIEDKYYQVESATTTTEAYAAQVMKTSLLRKALSRLFIQSAYATDYYAGAGDGYVFWRDRDTTWATGVGATNGDDHYGVTPNDTTANVLGVTVSYWDASINRADIGRSFLPFNTSSIGSGSTISAASISLYVITGNFFNQDNDGDNLSGIFQSTQTATNTLAVGDYSQCGSTLGMDSAVDMDTISVDQYKAHTLNSTGWGWISKTGWSTFCWREGHDYLNQTPASGTNTGVVWNSSEAADTSTDPYLSVTYAASAATYIDGFKSYINIIE